MKREQPHHRDAFLLLPTLDQHPPKLIENRQRVWAGSPQTGWLLSILREVLLCLVELLLVPSAIVFFFFFPALVLMLEILLRIPQQEVPKGHSASLRQSNRTGVTLRTTLW